MRKRNLITMLLSKNKLEIDKISKIQVYGQVIFSFLLQKSQQALTDIIVTADEISRSGLFHYSINKYRK